MRGTFAVVAGACLALAAVALPPATGGALAAEARNSEQVIFSGGGTGDFGAPTPFGFWVWCEADSENPYAGLCHGAMYFYAVGLVRSVRGAIVEVDEGEYQMIVTSLDHAVSCTLQNAPPSEHGPVNTVNVQCTAPGGNGTSASAVVNVTGPPSAG